MAEEVEQETVLKVPCLVMSRVVGYLTPVDNWHRSKQQEFKDRKVFDIHKALPEEGTEGK